MAEYTLLLRLAGPLQSWGTDSRFEIRRTEMIPTKSGILGLIASALGRQRDEQIDDLKELKIGIRIDAPGEVITDFHIAKSKDQSYLTRRNYLADAVFIAGVESESYEKLKLIEEALRAPAYPLFLGRRSCPPEMPLILGIVEQPLIEALRDCAFWGPAKSENRKTLPIFVEGRSGNIVRRVSDEPVSYDFHHRQYKSRYVSELHIPNPRCKESEDEAGKREKREFETGFDVFDWGDM